MSVLVNGIEVPSRDLSALAAQLARGGNQELATRIGLAIDGNREELLLARREAALIVALIDGELDFAALQARLAEPPDKTR